jgi:Flp pilus assembly protein TadB
MIAWLALAGALALAPTPAAPTPAAMTDVAAADNATPFGVQRQLSPRVQQAITGSAAALPMLLLLPYPRSVVVAAVVGPAAVVLLRRLAVRGERVRPAPSLPLVLCLAAAALRAGSSTVAALELALPAGEPEAAALLQRVVGLLRLGSSSEQAWSLVPPEAGLVSIAAAARRSETSGIKLAEAFERAAADLASARHASAKAKAERVGVLAVGPLGLCFLPAFVCLGIVPVVIAVAAGIGGQLR